MTPVLQLKNIRKSFGGVTAIQDFSLDLHAGEVVALVGDNGAGKSTLIKALSGAVTPDHGEILLDGKPVHFRNPDDARAVGIETVYQNLAMSPALSIADNMFLGREWRAPGIMGSVFRKMDHARMQKFAREKLNELGLMTIQDITQPVETLSGGQRQRAALARAVVRQPQVFLMDEPLSNLDAKLRQSMRVQIKHMQRQLKVTTVYVTHDQIEAMTLADRIVIMNKGAIQQVGTPDEIYSDPANTFVAGFIGSPPMNLIEGTARDGRFTAPGITVPCPHFVHGKVTLGVRPEDCRVGGDHLQGQVYGVEPTGDVTYLTVLAGSKKIEVKAARDYRSDIDVAIGIAFDPAHLYFFDESGQRIRGTA